MQQKILDPRVNPLSAATAGSAGYDLQASSAFGDRLHDGETVVIAPGETVTIGTGICVDLGSDDWGLAALVLPRSGLGCKGLTPANAPGLIDSDYQGEIKVCLANRGAEPARIAALDRIAQLLIVPIYRPDWEVVEVFERQTERGEGGFGSTGESAMVVKKERTGD